MILMARWMFGCVCLGREQSVICHSGIVLFLIPPVIVKCSGEFLMEFGINWHPPILQPGPGRRGRGRDADMEMETIYSLRGLAGWLAVSDLTVCVLMTQEICVVPGIVSSLISRHCLSSQQAVSLLCYSVFLISILKLTAPPPVVVPLWAVH